MLDQLRWMLVTSLLVSTACGGDDGDSVACGTGTVERDGICVVAEGAAPTVTSIDPVEDFLGGGATFTIKGTGFTAQGAGDTSVTFGTVAAVFSIVDDTTITGTVPFGAAVTPTVTVTNKLGEATVPFTYTGLYAAQGRGAEPGDLLLVDPRDGRSLAIGPVVDSGTPRAITGMEFAPDGTLYAVEAVIADEPEPHLLTINKSTGAARSIGVLTDGTKTHPHISDVAFAGNDLIGWTESGDDPVSIDTTTGAVTILAPGSGSSGDGLVELADGTLLIAIENVPGTLYTLDPTTGLTTATSVAMSGIYSSADVCAMTRFRGTIYALLCYQGGRLATLDPTTGVLTPLPSAPAGIDAIASTEPNLVNGKVAPRIVAAAPEPVCARGVATTTVRGERRGDLVASALASRADATALPGSRKPTRGVSLAAGLGSLAGTQEIELASCDGDTRRVPSDRAGDFMLVANQRGQLKLVDATGRVALRNITTVTAR